MNAKTIHVSRKKARRILDDLQRMLEAAELSTGLGIDEECCNHCGAAYDFAWAALKKLGRLRRLLDDAPRAEPAASATPA